MKAGFRFAAPAGVLAILIALFSVLDPRFASPENLTNIVLQISITGLIACGMTFAVLTGGLDLSVGSVAALSGVIFVLMVDYGIWTAGAIALISGTLVGAVNGFLIGRFRLNALVVTLAALAWVQGVALWLSHGYPVAGPGEDFEMLGGGFFLYIPLPIIFFLIAVWASWFLLGHTQFGRDLYAIGGNREAAELADVPVQSREWLVYAGCSALAAFSGMVLASRLNTGSPIVGQDAPLQAIVAVVLGGNSLSGGRGGVFQTVLGLASMGVLANGLNLLNVPPAVRWGITGCILTAFAGLDTARTRRRQQLEGR
jgi:ribose transport system permease protein